MSIHKQLIFIIMLETQIKLNKKEVVKRLKAAGWYSCFFNMRENSADPELTFRHENKKYEIEFYKDFYFTLEKPTPPHGQTPETETFALIRLKRD